MGTFDLAFPLSEEPIKIIKFHWIAYIKVVAKIFITATVLFILLFPTVPFWWQTYYGRIGIFIFFSVSVVFLVKDFWKKFATAYIITGEKLVDVTQEKVLKRVVTEIEIENIEKIKIKKNFLRRKLFNVGDIIFGLKNEVGILVFYNIRSPLEVKKIINGLIEEKKEIVNQRGEECRVEGEPSAEEKVPLTVSYFGEKLKQKNKENLKIVKKNKI